MNKEEKLKDIITSLEQINSDLIFQIKYTAKIAAIHEICKNELKYLKECKTEKLERIKVLEAEVG